MHAFINATVPNEVVKKFQGESDDKVDRPESIDYFDNINSNHVSFIIDKNTDQTDATNLNNTATIIDQSQIFTNNSKVECKYDGSKAGKVIITTPTDGSTHIPNST
jgi:hypothetical protein